uniref:Sushi domain-containing protein n=1 Tax=Naja naja TaxID=35670 RepID=A0A8C6X6R0_NAJNA
IQTIKLIEYSEFWGCLTFFIPFLLGKGCNYVRIENGRMTEYYERYKPFPLREGQTVDFHCEHGFLPANQQTWQRATCINSRYEPELKCFIERTCKKISISHGYFESQQQSFQINAKTKYNCHNGYSTSKGETQAETQCLTEGWSPEPECIKACLKPLGDEFIFNTTKSVFFPGDKLHYECKEGFQITNNTINDTVMCTEKGWELIPSCVCKLMKHQSNNPITPFLENGTIKPREDIFQHNMVVHFICNEGFTRVGSESAQCYHFGWSPQPPICKGKNRQFKNYYSGSLPLPLSASMASLNIFQHGDLLEVQCDISFALYGSKIIECVDGEWTPLPSCIRKQQLYNGYMKQRGKLFEEEGRTCGPPPTIKNGFFLNAESSIYRHGDTVEYRCQQHSTLIGTSLAKCLHGQWEVPLCLGNCPPPPQLPNAINVAEMRTYKTDEEISFKCQDHFLLRGPQKIKCEAGKWRTPPRCLGLYPFVHSGFSVYTCALFQETNQVLCTLYMLPLSFSESQIRVRTWMLKIFLYVSASPCVCIWWQA